MNRKFSPRSAAALLLLALLLTAPAPRAQAAAGDLDTLNTDIDGRVYATAVQPDGKILVAGSFLFPGGQERYGIARLNANGTLDTSFNANLDITSVEVNCVAVQPDGKILIVGNFNRSAEGSGHGHSDIMRLNADGSTDGSWTPLGTLYRVYCVAVQPDGKILIGGTTTHVIFEGGGLIDRNYVARLEANGAPDTSFNANIGAILAGDVRSVAVQADGRILIGGNFSTVGGVTRQGFARLEANGALDASFDANLNSTVNCVVLQPNGKILIGGLFSSVGGVSRGRVARLEPNGALDGAFDPNANQNVNSIALQADGKVLLGGIFTTLQPKGAGAAITRNRIARVNADGTLDLAFDPNANNAVYSVALQGDGMVLVGGNFTSLQPNGAGAPTTRNRLARLLNDPATQTLSAPDTAHITWVRAGTVPEVSRVTFEVSTDGGATWGAPIAPVRGGVLSNWRVDGGIALPASGLLRARGATLGGYYSASSGRIEQVLSFSGIPNAPEITVTGNGAVIPDGDTTPGLPDGTEFHAAFGASTAVRTFTITNTGTAALNLTGTPKVVVSGTHAADFAVTLQPASPLAATNGATTFQVTFTPGAVGVRNATLTFANDDANEATFDFAVTGRGLSFTQDTDGDGLNDASELLGAALGFNWQASQPALVQTYNGIANGAGLYTTAQVQALHMDVPLIQRNPGTNTFTFTFGLRKSTTLAPGSFVPFPFTPAGTSVNGAGKVQYQFTAPDNAAFFRLEMP